MLSSLWYLIDKDGSATSSGSEAACPNVSLSAEKLNFFCYNDSDSKDNEYCPKNMYV